MMFAVPSEPYEVSPTVVHALKQLLILHADHEQNCSTSTVRLVGSSRRQHLRVDRGRHQRAVGPAARRRQPGRDRDARSDPRRRRRRRQATSTRAKDPERRLPPLGLRPPRRTRTTTRAPASSRRRPSACSTELGSKDELLRHRARARAGRAHRRVLHRAEALPERRLLLGPHLPGDGLPHQHVPRAVRDRPAPRLDRALEGRCTRTRRRRSAARARSTPARPSASTSRSKSANADCRRGSPTPRLVGRHVEWVGRRSTTDRSPPLARTAAAPRQPLADTIDGETGANAFGVMSDGLASSTSTTRHGTRIVASSIAAVIARPPIGDDRVHDAS